jgi:hypothetical protein
MPKKFSKGSPSPRWGRGLLKEVTTLFTAPRKSSRMFGINVHSLPKIEGTPMYELQGLHQDDKLWWLLYFFGKRNIGPVGGGFFQYRNKPRRVLREVRVALKPEHQGRGLYPLLLKDLRIELNRPLESDMILSPQNRRAWEKAEGVYDPQTRRYHINPARMTKIESQIRASWLIMEGKLPRNKKVRN